MNDLIQFQKQRIGALEKLCKMQEDLINALTLRNDELMFDVAEAKSQYNILVRNITVIDEIIEQPLKN